MLSTNPIAFGVPAFGELPHDVIVDISTSQVAGSILKEHFLSGKPLDPEWTITADGEPLLDAAQFMQGLGAMLPLGGESTGHKGYAMAVIAEILAAIAGGMMAGEHDPEWFNNAALFFFLDPTRFLPANELGQRVSALADYLQTGGARLPGSGAYERKEKTQKNGLDLPEHHCNELKALANDLGVEIPAALTDIVNAQASSDSTKTW